MTRSKPCASCGHPKTRHRAHGNGVVPAQAAAALRHLLFVRDSALEAA